MWTFSKFLVDLLTATEPGSELLEPGAELFQPGSELELSVWASGWSVVDQLAAGSELFQPESELPGSGDRSVKGSGPGLEA